MMHIHSGLFGTGLRRRGPLIFVSKTLTPGKLLVLRPMAWMARPSSALRGSEPSHATTTTSTIIANFDNFDISVSDARPVYGPETGLDVEDAMLGTNGSIYMRFPFTFDGDPSQLDELDLVTRYDDGFVAYLNGQKLAAENVPIDSSWDSTASGSFGAVNGQIPVRYFQHVGRSQCVAAGRRTCSPCKA